jgi:hypothetical protein
MKRLKMDKAEREAALLDIARRFLGVNSFEPRHSDDLDFYDHAVWQVREALEADYDAGYRAAGGQITDNDE